MTRELFEIQLPSVAARIAYIVLCIPAWVMIQAVTATTLALHCAVLLVGFIPYWVATGKHLELVATIPTTLGVRNFAAITDDRVIRGSYLYVKAKTIEGVDIFLHFIIYALATIAVAGVVITFTAFGA